MSSRVAMVAVWCAALLACSADESKETPGSDATGPAALVTVNGQPITEDDVQAALESGIDGTKRGDREGVTNALIRRKAMATAAERSLSPEAKQELQTAVDNEHEKLLVAEYAKVAVEPDPVSHAMVERYYNDHPELFGARASKVCEAITTDRPLTDSEQRKLEPLLSGAAARTDWKAWAFELRLTGIPVVHQTGLISARLHRGLHAEAEKLPLGGVSKPRVVLGTPFVLRVTGEERQEPRPLGEVAHEIRLALAPNQLAKAIKQTSDLALKQVKVEYTEQAPK